MQNLYAFCVEHQLVLHTSSAFGETYRWIELSTFKGSKSQRKNAIKEAKAAMAKYLKDTEKEYNTLLNTPEKEYDYPYAPDMLYIKEQEEIKEAQHSRVLQYITKCNNILHLLEETKLAISHSEIFK